MLDTMVEHVIGIDPDRDRVTASVVDTSTTGEQATAVFQTTRLGYDRLLKWADQHTQTADRGVVGGRLGQLRSRRDHLSRRPRGTGGGVQRSHPDPRRRQNRRTGRPAGRPPSAGTPLAICPTG